MESYGTSLTFRMMSLRASWRRLLPRLNRPRSRARNANQQIVFSYDLFLRGMAASYRGRTASKALEFFHGAIELDEEFAAAYAMVAYVALVEQAVSGLTFLEVKLGLEVMF